MTYQFDLSHRAARCVSYANDGNACILVVTDADRAEAQALVGDAPVIVATGGEAREFLMQWVPGAFGPSHGGRRRAAK